MILDDLCRNALQRLHLTNIEKQSEIQTLCFQIRVRGSSGPVESSVTPAVSVNALRVHHASLVFVQLQLALAAQPAVSGRYLGSLQHRLL